MSRMKIGEKTRQLDQVTKADLDMFRRARTNANVFTNHYLKTPASGTYWKRFPEEENQDKIAAYQRLFERWQDDGSPDNIFETVLYDGAGDNRYQFNVMWDEDEWPIFHHNHGWLFQNWQLEFHHCQTPEITVIGGFGSGKTAGFSGSAAVLAATIPYVRIFIIAPQMIQVTESYNYIVNNFSDTLWWNRWVWRNITKPYPLIELRSSHIGRTTIEFLSVESDPEKIRTLEGDAVYLDQGEKFGELDDLIRDVGSRLRGYVRGRSRLGRLAVFANAGSNPELWSRFEMEEHDPETFKSFRPKSWDNIYLTPRQINDMKRRVGGTVADIDQWMGALKPLGAGVHFPATMVEGCRNMDLNSELEGLIAKYTEEEHPDPPAWVRTLPDVGTYEWVTPPDHEGGRKYIVIGDPGSGNPPKRNAGAIGVWDVTNFPQQAATLRAFFWTYGNGFLDPFNSRFEWCIRKYRAQGRAAFDSTGPQKGYDEMYYTERGLIVTGLNMGGSGKAHCLNAAKTLMGHMQGNHHAPLMVIPYIARLENQLTNYVLPDTKIAQDLVMMVVMSAEYMHRLFYFPIAEDGDDPVEAIQDFDDRNTRPSESRTFREA